MRKSRAALLQVTAPPMRQSNLNKVHQPAEHGSLIMLVPLRVTSMMSVFGKIQRAVLLIIRCHGEPMTFADMCRTEAGEKIITASLDRSFRRAVHQLTKRMCLSPLGDGGPGDPLRYCFHPLFITVMSKTPESASTAGGDSPTSVPQNQHLDRAPV